MLMHIARRMRYEEIYVIASFQCDFILLLLAVGYFSLLFIGLRGQSHVLHFALCNLNMCHRVLFQGV
jgi:hypothetical protein